MMEIGATRAPTQPRPTAAQRAHRWRIGLVVVAALGVAEPATAAPEGWNVLVDPAELAAMLEGEPELRVLHIGWGFDDGHIPGAVEAPLSSFRGDLENPGAIPPLDRVFAKMRGWGLEPDAPTVVVHDGFSSGDFGNAARVYWSLKSLGVEEIAILNGGLAGWIEAGLPVSVAPTTPEPSRWEPTPDGTWRITTEVLRERLAAGAPMTLVDARPAPFFEGRERHAAASRPGTIPGAVNLPFDAWFEGAVMRPAGEVRAEIRATGLVEAERPVVTFCNTGIFAATSWFALSEIAEIDDVRLYSSSMVEWSQAGGEMANVPGRVTHYWRMFATWIADLFA